MGETTHQYVERGSGAIRSERLFQDRWVRLLYDEARERAPVLFRALTGARASALLAAFHYDFRLGSRLAGGARFLRDWGIDLGECMDDPESLDTLRKVFERKIRFWECRPMPEDPEVVVAPADSRCLLGSLDESSLLLVKGKFFDVAELVGNGLRWPIDVFARADWAILRLTPEKYHWVHLPVSGRVEALYELDGAHHACNPAAVVTLATPYSKNRRVVTILNTDVPGGSRVGLVAVVEVVALMVGAVDQAYSIERYDNPIALAPGTFARRGAAKALFRPGSSTVVVLFEPGRVAFSSDLRDNLRRPGVRSRFSSGFGIPLVETEVRAREEIGRRKPR
jgi:phosphatidylserine decarboxylase